MRVKRQTKSREKNRPPKPHNPKLSFIEHLHELRRRLFYIALSVGVWGAAAYLVQQQIVTALLKPAHNQQFIYTSVGGGIDFLFRVCIYTGVVFSIPVIVYHLLKYLQPLIKKDAVKFIAWGSVASGVLAFMGMAFGYFVGLPAALHFLLHQFTTSQIHPLLTIQSYMSFVTMYMLGSALLFQLPLILILINRIKPLKPRKLLGYERWVILIAFILGGIMNPSPRIQDQILLAGPMVVAYQVGVLIVWLTNRRGHPEHVQTLLEKDAAERAARQERFMAAQAALCARRANQQSQPTVAASAALAPASAQAPAASPVQPVIAAPAPVSATARPRRYADIARPRGGRGSYTTRFSRRPVYQPLPPQNSARAEPESGSA